MLTIMWVGVLNARYEDTNERGAVLQKSLVGVAIFSNSSSRGGGGGVFTHMFLEAVVAQHTLIEFKLGGAWWLVVSIE